MSTDNTAAPSNLVSIICRTIGREELTQALDSIASQTYSNIEVVLVNSARQDLSQFDISQINAIVINPEQKLSRTQAANAGLEAANGTYLMFLDDDDWIAESHVEFLVAALESNQDCKAAYSSTVKTHADGSPTDYVFDRDYDPLLLMRDNYIPIHAVLFDEEVIALGCRFDETFDIYEDWDFWLQLAQHTTFDHVNKQTAFYRAEGNSDTATEDDTLRFQSDHLLGKARAAIFDKWKEQWDGDLINQMLGNAMRFDLSAKVEELTNRLAEEFRKSSAHIDKLNKALRERDSAIQDRNEKLHQFQLKLNAIENDLRHKTNIEKHLKFHVQQLESELNRILSSPSWRVMGPARRIGRLFSGTEYTVEFQEQPIEEAEEQADAKAVQPNESADYSDKAEYDKDAKQALESFLESEDRLQFCVEESPLISIILVFYNQAHLSLLCLQSLLEHGDTAFELIVIDNASSDSSNALLDKMDNANIVRNTDNLGFVKAVNQGAELARGEYLLLLNNDAVIHERTLSAALSSIRDDASVGAVGGKIVLTDGSLQEAGSIIWRDGSCLGYGRGGDPDAGAYQFERDVDYCSGAFLLFRQSDFKELGGFDLDYAPAYYEESDFCIRLQKKGLRVVYNPKAIITHYEFASSGGISGAVALQKEHQTLLCEKHGDWLEKQRVSDPTEIILARSANRNPNVLVIDDRVPHPSLGSGYPRAAHLLNSLEAMDLNITFYPLQFPVDDWLETYRTLASGIEVILDSGRMGLQAFLESRKDFFQYIIVSRVHNMAFFKELMEAAPGLTEGVKLIYDAEALTAPREIMQKKLNQQLISEQEISELYSKEMEQANAADLVIAVSNKESETYKEHGIETVSVLGHTLQATPGKKEFSAREGILFVGALRDEGSPNVDSMLWFTVNVLPLIEAAIPEIKLHVVGDKSAQSLASIEKSNVSFLGRVDKLDDVYNNCKLFIAPTRFAAGIPHKVHEAAAMGLPSVTTPLLAEQLGWQHEKELLIGADPKGFADQCVRLYQDEGLWQSVRSAALEAADSDCSDAQFQENLKSLFD
ncbi:MAG: glycosyltransferase [Pseudomonadales bacterium]|nr:glycosyltransferase [Pseudomonadales bacterium]